jgi:large subunit ribosomal protein L32
MGLPKRKVSHARQGDRRAHAAQGDRRAHSALAAPQLQECPHCHEQKLAHHACPNCGWYRGRQVLHIKTTTPGESER